MHHIVYASTSFDILSTNELNGILKRARLTNAANNITGLLLYNDGNFLQVLEGEKDIIHNCYKRIGNDPRHYGIFKLLDEPITQRAFQNWSIAYISYGELSASQKEGFSSLTSMVADHDEDTITNSQVIVHSYLKMFNMI